MKRITDQHPFRFKLKWLGKTGKLEADFSKLADKYRNGIKTKKS